MKKSDYFPDYENLTGKRVSRLKSSFDTFVPDRVRQKNAKMLIGLKKKQGGTLKNIYVYPPIFSRLNRENWEHFPFFSPDYEKLIGNISRIAKTNETALFVCPCRQQRPDPHGAQQLPQGLLLRVHPGEGREGGRVPFHILCAQAPEARAEGPAQGFFPHVSGKMREKFPQFPHVEMGPGKIFPHGENIPFGGLVKI